jgi:hypothetical protein
MKLFGIILSFYLLFLSIQPGLKLLLLSKTRTACCAGCTPVKQDDTEKKGSAPTKADCNPFESCKSCIGYTVTFSGSLIEHYFFKQVIRIPFSVTVPKNLALDFWQPPKIC